MSQMVLSIIHHGYYLPLMEDPVCVNFKNHLSAINNQVFVETAITDLLKAGSVCEVQQQDIVICSPLGIVPKKNGKLRLILDLRYLNKHLFVRKFKYEDLLVVSQIAAKGDWFITFDLCNGYHHIDIGWEHWKYLGFSFPITIWMCYVFCIYVIAL